MIKILYDHDFIIHAFDHGVFVCARWGFDRVKQILESRRLYAHTLVLNVVEEVGEEVGGWRVGEGWAGEGREWGGRRMGLLPPPIYILMK